MSKKKTNNPAEQKDFQSDFLNAITKAGLTPPSNVLADGKIHRFSSNGKKGDDAGWYVYREGGIPTGEFGCWRSGEQFSWKANLGRPLTDDEKKLLKAETEALRRLQDKERVQRRGEAKQKAEEILKSARPASSNPYLERKKISAHGIYTYKDALVIPLRDKAGDLCSLQFINEDGSKKFLSGGQIKGCYHLIGEPTDKICVSEGYATGAAIYEATGVSTAVAFNAGNLSDVARSLGKKFPESRIIVCADDDWITKGNPGLTKATEAAHAVGGALAIPEFNEPRDEKATDFNDMALLCGVGKVREVIEAAINADVTGVNDVTASYNKELSVTAEVTPLGADAVDSSFENVPIDERPCFKVLEDFTQASHRKYAPGVWFFSVKYKQDEEVPIEQWVCSPIHVDAVTHDTQNNNFGRLLRFRNSIGQWREWAMPMEMLRGSGDELRGELLSMGAHLSPDNGKLLLKYLQWKTPEKRMRCALQVGWCDHSYVLPDVVIGANAGDVIFQSGERGHEEHTQAGTLEDWKELIAKKAIRNPLLITAISAAFAGPLLQKCNAESGGLHFVGDSSTGKTTAIEAACSVWGGQNFRRSWRATSNGMEGVAALFNDCLLALDEISECDPHEVGAIVYALANGRGKQRASRTGNARNITRWRCSVLSSGERTIATTMAEGGYRIKAGQTVRLLDIPATRKHGTWDDLHGFNSGAAFSDALRSAVTAHHGKAGRAFLERLTRDEQNFPERLEGLKAMQEFSCETGQGQDKRVAARFALIGLAGEVATEYGLTGWPAGEALQSAAASLQAWRSLRGGRDNDERYQIQNKLLEFIEKHGDSRFSDTVSDMSQIRDRAGWWEDKNGERLFHFTSPGLREALKEFDFKRALDVLEELGILPASGSSGERGVPKRFSGRLVRVYSIAGNKLVRFESGVAPMPEGVAPNVTPKNRKIKGDTSVTPVTAEIKEKPKKYERRK